MRDELLNNPELKKKTKEFAEANPDVYDIVLYGSCARGKLNPNDIDIAILLKRALSLNDKLVLSQKFRKKVEFLGTQVDVQVVSINDLEDPAFLARSAILAEGYSILDESFHHSRFGFACFSVFSYDLTGLTTSKKKTLYYALKGREDKAGLIKERKASVLGSSLIKVPIEHTEEFKQFFDSYGCKYKTWVSCEYA